MDLEKGIIEAHLRVKRVIFGRIENQQKANAISCFHEVHDSRADTAPAA